MSNIIEIGGGASGSAVLIPKTITANGTYRASDDSADGYDVVTVNVSGAVSTLALHSGKINLTTGEIIEDANYYYTDEFPCPNGSIVFDMGLSSSASYVGVVSYDENGIRKGAADTTTRYRTVNLSNVYASGARKLRLSFPIEQLANIILKDYVNGLTYTTNPVFVKTIN